MIWGLLFSKDNKLRTQVDFAWLTIDWVLVDFVYFLANYVRLMPAPDAFWFFVDV